MTDKLPTQFTKGFARLRQDAGIYPPERDFHAPPPFHVALCEADIGHHQRLPLIDHQIADVTDTHLRPLDRSTARPLDGSMTR